MKGWPACPDCRGSGYGYRERTCHRWMYITKATRVCSCSCGRVMSVLALRCRRCASYIANLAADQARAAVVRKPYGL